jgi:CRISPR/Cas system-associated exonuclease Cas4 (RecB family)
MPEISDQKYPSPYENTAGTMSELQNPFTFSQSSLQDYADCARRFQLRYIERLQWPAVETAPVLDNERRQLEGQQFHRMVQQSLIGLPAEKLARMANTDNLSRWWDNFLAHGPLLDGFKLYPELTLSAPVGKHRLVAKYDLLAIGAEKALIFDWKTYHKRPKDEWMSARLQTKVYRALLVAAGAHLNGGKVFEPEQIEMSYWYADFPSEPSIFSYTTKQHKRDWVNLFGLVSEIDAKQSFPMTDDEKKCAYCPYRSYCNRGITAGALEDVDTELSTLDVTLEQIQEIEF